MRSAVFAALLASSVVARPFDRRQAISSVLSAPTSLPFVASLPSVASSLSSANATSASSTAAASVTSTSSASASSASASTNPQALYDAIRARNANGVASLLEANPSIGQSLEQYVGVGKSPITIILPDDDAISSVDSTNATYLTTLFSNHILFGNVTAASIPAVGVYRNILTSYVPNGTNGTGHQQYVVLDRNATTGTTVLGGKDNGTILANSTYANVLFKLSTGLVQLAQNASATLANQPNVSTLYSLLGGIPQVVNTADSASAITIFAPTNSALASLAGSASSLSNTTIATVIQNHVIAQTLYSPNITSSTQAQNLNGSPVSFMTNSTGVFVTSGGATAQVVMPNIQLYNGVVHLIDRVLYSPNSTMSSANSTSSMSSSRASSSMMSMTSMSSSSAMLSSALSSAIPTSTA